MRPTPIRRLLAVLVAMTLLAAACAETATSPLPPRIAKSARRMVT